MAPVIIFLIALIGIIVSLLAVCNREEVIAPTATPKPHTPTPMSGWLEGG